MTGFFRSRGRRLALLAICTFLGLAIGGVSLADYPHPEAPRLLSLYLRSTIEGVEADLANFDFVVLSYKLLDKEPENVALLRSLNPDQTLLVYTHGLFMSATPEGQPGDAHYDFWAGVDSLWIAYNEFGDSIAFQNAIALNFTDACPEVGGQQYSDYFINFVETRLYPYIEDGTIDGIYLDGMNERGYEWWDLYFPGFFDYDLNNIADDPEQVRLWTRDAITRFADELSATLPAGAYILGANCRPFQPNIHGKLFEGFPAEGEGELAGTLNSLDLWNSTGPAGELSALNGIPEYPALMSEFRYRYAGSLLSDNYFSYDYDFWDHNQTEWFQLFDFQLGMPQGMRSTILESPTIAAEFESGMDPNILEVATQSQISITSDPGQVILGDQSLLVETITADPRPKLIEIVPPDPLIPFEYYTISMRYHVLSCDEAESNLQMVATFSASCPLVTSPEIPVVAGSSGLLRTSLHLGSCDDYSIFLQIKGGATVVLDDIHFVVGEGGLWTRDYDNGLVVVNDSGSNKVLPWMPTWELVEGENQTTDYSLWLFGADITLPNKDGLVFSHRSADIFINEFLTENVDLNGDEMGDHEDWIEIYNARDIAIDLGGFTLTNDLGNPTKFVIPNGTIVDPGGFKLIWCDGETGEGPLHAPFTLDNAGGEIGFFGPEATGSVSLDSYSFGPQTADVSTGRETDGNLPWITFVRPTPNGSNHIVGVEDATPGALALLGNHPNPFNPKTRISFMAPETGSARLEVFDLSGRSVAVLVDGPVAAGINSVDWDGRDQAGTPQPSGVYFTRVTMNGESSEGKMLMLR